MRTASPPVNQRKTRTAKGFAGFSLLDAPIAAAIVPGAGSPSRQCRLFCTAPVQGQEPLTTTYTSDRIGFVGSR